MKKQMNEKTEEVKVLKKEKKSRKFFLYVDGKGFIHLDKEVGATPNFDNGEILWYPSRRSALYAREFFISIKLADSIDILTKVA